VFAAASGIRSTQVRECACFPAVLVLGSGASLLVAALRAQMALWRYARGTFPITVTAFRERLSAKQPLLDSELKLGDFPGRC